MHKHHKQKTDQDAFPQAEAITCKITYALYGPIKENQSNGRCESFTHTLQKVLIGKRQHDYNYFVVVPILKSNSVVARQTIIELEVGGGGGRFIDRGGGTNKMMMIN